jgi:hypothetical protein
MIEIDAFTCTAIVRTLASLSDQFDRQLTDQEIAYVISEAIRQLSAAPSKRLH